MAELAAKHDVHLNMIAHWKRQAKESLPDLFSKKARRSEAELEEALGNYGRPENFNTDQGSQLTSLEFTEVLKEAGVRISMDDRGRWMDNVFIERLWRSLKYECIYLHEFDDGIRAREGIAVWMRFYNEERPHSLFEDDRTPMDLTLSLRQRTCRASEHERTGR